MPPITVPSPVIRWLRRIKCLLKGHPCKPTGRSAILLVEWKCERCGGVYVSHVHHGRVLADADAHSDQIFRDYLDATRASEVMPNQRVDNPES